MNELAVVDKGADWRRLKSLVLDSVSSPITKRVYNLGLDEFPTTGDRRLPLTKLNVRNRLRPSHC
jgi:hypothetical protein